MRVKNNNNYSYQKYVEGTNKKCMIYGKSLKLGWKHITHETPNIKLYRFGWPGAFRVRIRVFKFVDAHIVPGRDGHGSR